MMAARAIQQIQKEAISRLFSRDLGQNTRLTGFHAQHVRDLHVHTRLKSPFSREGKLRKMCQRMTEKLNSLAVLFARQCNAIAAQRVRRTVQIFNHFSKLGYDKEAFKRHVLDKVGQGIFQRNHPLYALLAASLFKWDEDGISKEELQEVASDISHLERAPDSPMTRTPQLAEDDHLMDGWEKVIDKDHFKVWRKQIPESNLYQYKVFGTYVDLPARAFFNSQLDMDFRKTWDDLIIKLEVVDKNEETGDEVVQWVTHFPYPMYSREYIFIRNTMIDPKRKIMVVVNRGTDHPACPVQEQYVRVSTYMSNMVIRAHTNFDENGFDYVLTYYDEPKSAIPSVAYNWMARSGVPNFAEKYHAQAKKLYEMQLSQTGSEEAQSVQKASDKDQLNKKGTVEGETWQQQYGSNRQKMTM